MEKIRTGSIGHRRILPKLVAPVIRLAHYRECGRRSILAGAGRCLLSRGRGRQRNGGIRHRCSPIGAAVPWHEVRQIGRERLRISGGIPVSGSSGRRRHGRSDGRPGGRRPIRRKGGDEEPRARVCGAFRRVVRDHRWTATTFAEASAPTGSPGEVGRGKPAGGADRSAECGSRGRSSAATSMPSLLITTPDSTQDVLRNCVRRLPVLSPSLAARGFDNGCNRISATAGARVRRSPRRWAG